MCLAFLWLAGLNSQPAVRAEDSSPTTVEKSKSLSENGNPATSEEAIRKALKKEVSWDFQETPLSKVAEVLQKDLNVPVLLDARALADIGVEEDTPITFKLSGTTAKTALNRLLKTLNMSYLIEKELLLLTSRDEADVNLTVVIYNVSDMPAFRRASGKTVPNYDQLVDLLAATVKPTTWEEVGGSGSIMPYDAGNVQVLVVSQTEEVHEEILELLNRLRKLNPAPLTPEEIDKLPPEPLPKPKPPQNNPGMNGMGTGGLPGQGMMGGMGGMGMGGMGMGGMTGPGMPGGIQGAKEPAAPNQPPPPAGPATPRPTPGGGMF
jgi:hypothetical protein